MNGMTNVSGAGVSVPDLCIRDLKACDVFQMVRILRKIGLKTLVDELGENFTEALEYEPPTMMDADGNEVPLPREQWTEAQERAEDLYLIQEQQFSSHIIGFLVDHLPDCEKEICKLIGDGVGLLPEKVADLDAMDFLELCARFIDRENFRDFFTQAVRLLQKTGSR